MKAHIRGVIEKANAEALQQAYLRTVQEATAEMERQQEQKVAELQAMVEKRAKDMDADICRRVFNQFILCLAMCSRVKPETVHKMMDAWENDIRPRWEYLEEQPDDDGHTCCDAWLKMEIEKRGFPYFDTVDPNAEV